MTTTARLDLSVWRNDDTYELPLRIVGPDLTGVVLRAQIRLAPDTPGAALAALELVTNANAEGVRLAGVTSAAGTFTNDVRLRLNKSTRRALPYAGEVGDAARLAWAFQIGGRTRIVGEVSVLAHAMDSDAAPMNRPAGFVAAGGLPAGGATLTIAGDEVVSLTIADAGLAAGFADQAADAASAAQLASSAAAAAGRYFASRALGEAGSTTGQFFSTDDGAGALIYYRRNPSGSAEIGRAMTPAVLAASTGASLIGYGGRSVAAKLGDVASVKDAQFAGGAIGDGIADDTAAINAAIDTGRDLFFPAGSYNYTPSGKQLAFAQSLYGVGHIISKINKIANGDMFKLHAGCSVRDIGLQGNGSSGATGRGFVIQGLWSNITLQNVNVLDMDGYCLEVTTNNGGSQLRILGGLWGRTDSDQPAIRLAPLDTQATPRTLVGVTAVGSLIDTYGGDTTIISSCYGRTMVFGDASKKVLVGASRFATIGNQIIIKGTDNVVAGCVIAGDVQFGPGASNCHFKATVQAGGFTFVDNSGNTSNETDFRIKASKTYNPPNIPDGGGDTTTLPCIGARPGMTTNVTFTALQIGVLRQADVLANDVVTVRFQNESGGTVDMASGTLSVVVFA
ncbi:hypothetical protein [Sphingomonas sp.]|uniref:hypothetical protein n=1 Tax=Sphingomonas sp. TaxID=28214 RepID=UPI003B008B95